MLSALIPSIRSYPAVLLEEQLVHQRYVHPGPLVLRTAPLKFPAPTTDRDRTVSRRSEPSSRTALMGEQPNPWDLLQPQDAMSRHRGAKPPRRCERSGEILLVTPWARRLTRHGGRVISARLCTSPCSTDCLITPPSWGPLVQSLRLLTAQLRWSCASLPADRPHPARCHRLSPGSVGYTEFPAYRGVVSLSLSRVSGPALVKP